MNDRDSAPRFLPLPALPSAAIARPRLSERLDSAAAITLVAGVPGSGRTTLVCSWAHSRGAKGDRVFWVPATAELSEPSALWGRLLGTADGSLERIVESLSASDSPTVIVLDDADTYVRPAHIREIVELVRLVSTTRVVIVGHVLPELPAAIAATRVRSWELHASADELAAIAASVGLPMPRMAVDAVLDSFQGWLTPSLIAFRAMADASAAGSAPVHAFELGMETATAFVREAFDGTGAVEALKPLWLWQCADELTAETARVTIGIEHPHRMIARLEDEGAIRPLPDSHPPAWRANLNPALSTMLTEEFSDRFADEARAAHRRLSSWALEHGDESSAVRHATAAEDWKLVTELLGIHWSSLLSTSADTLRESLNALPQQFLDSNPRWIEARNFANFIPASGEARPIRYRHTVRQPTESLMDRLASLTSRSASFRFSGQFAEAAATAAEAESALLGVAPDELGMVEHVLPELRIQWAISFELAGESLRALAAFETTYDEALARDNLRIAVDAAGNLAMMLAFIGLDTSASHWLARIPPFTEDPSSLQAVHTAGYLARAIIALDLLDLDEARTIATTRIDQTRSPEQWAIHEALLAQLAALVGDARARLATLRGALAVKTPAPSSGINRWIVLVAQADLLIAGGQASAASTLLDSADPPQGGSVREYVDTARARAALFSGDAARAAEIATRHVVAESTGVRTLAELLLVLAVVDVGAARADDAVVHFRSALDLIETHRFPLVLARIPRDSFAALVALPGCTVPGDVLRKVSATNSLSVAVDPLSSLSRRERDVLRELVAGTSIDQIAREQFVTRNTVKTQVRSIYRKLGTSSREETIRVARTLPGL